MDIDRYSGLWYEVARVPNRFQDHCVRNVTAVYVPRDDGQINVINRCVKEDGSEDKSEGLARIEDTTSNAYLKVSFFSVLGWRPVWGDYMVVGLGDEYEYALVGVPDRNYGWILSRDPQLSESEAEELLSQMLEKGYEPGSFVLTPQDWEGSG